MKPKRFIVVLLLCLSTSTMVLGSAAAQSYQSLVEKGLREYELGNFGEARAFFLRAHQESPNARTLRGLGMASYELRHYVEAIDYFQRALASQERPLTDEMRSEISQLLIQARSFITRLRLDVTPAAAELRLNTRALVRDSDGSVLLDPGIHELIAEAADYETIARTIRCEAGETLTLVLTLKPIRRRQQPVADAQPPPSAASAAGPGVAAYIVIGAAAAVAVSGGVLLAIALHNKDVVEHPEQSAAEPRFADYKGKADSVLPLSAAGITALSLGLAGVAAGLAWNITSNLTSSEHAPRAQLAVSPAGVLISGQF